MALKEYPRLFLEGEDIPSAALGVECKRENSTGDHPPLNRIHIWWARRPLAASRFAIVGSLVGDDWTHEDILEIIGVPRGKDPVLERERIDNANKRGEKLSSPFGYRRAFLNPVNSRILKKFKESSKSLWGTERPTILDPFSGGGSIPFEGLRLGLDVKSVELNPVACVGIDAVTNIPLHNGGDLNIKLKKIGDAIANKLEVALSQFFPKKQGEKIFAYIWVRSIICPKCGFNAPLTSNWWLDTKNGLAFKPIIIDGIDFPEFKIEKAGTSGFNPDKGSQSGGAGVCVRCGKTISSEYIKEEAQKGKMGNQLAAVGFQIKGKSGRYFRPSEKMDIEGYNAAEKELEKKWSEFEHQGLIPMEEIPYGKKTAELINKGMFRWCDLFNHRQLLVHLTTLESIMTYDWDKIENEREKKALRTLAVFAMDKGLDYNSLQSRIDTSRTVVKNTFDRHDFAFKWNYGEMDGAGQLFRWCIDQVADAYKGCCDLLKGSDGVLDLRCADSRDIHWIPDGSVHAVVTDPPYYENVMYSELSDFFYVWQKRSIGDIHPDWYSSIFTDKDREAVANSSRFKEVVGEGSSASGMALEDYEMKMTQAWQETHRVLVDGGVLTIMFNHKKLEAWDALAKSIVNAGFTVTSSLAVNTESEHSLHIREKQAVQRTILLVARKMPRGTGGWWEDVKRSLRIAVEEKLKKVVKETPHLSRIDLLMSAYGEGLRIVSSNWPVRDSRGGEIAIADALVAARAVLQDWYFENRVGHRTDIDIQTKVVLYALEGYGERTAEYDDVRTYGMALGMDIQDLYSSNIAERSRSKVLFISPQERIKQTSKIDPGREHYSLVWDMVQAASLSFENSSVDDFRRWLRNKGFMANQPFLDACVFLATEGPSDRVETKMARSIHAVAPSPTTTGAVQKKMFDYTG